MGLEWEWFDVRAGSHLRHSVTLKPSAEGSDLLFFNAVSSPTSNGRITPELVEAFNGLLLDTFSVSEGHSRGSGDMPTIVLGHPPAVRITNDVSPTDLLRALANLPKGARLLPI